MQASATGTADAASYTGSAAYDPFTLPNPAQPDPRPNLEFDIVLDGAAGASLEHNIPMYGFSIEMSVSNTILGHNGSVLNVPFLNAISAITQRSGEIHIRVGGNSQEGAALVPATPNNRVIEKIYDEALLTGTTKTPPLYYTNELLYMMNNISSLVPIKWYMGIPFNETTIRMAIVDESQAILGDNLLGLQAGNEPDFYGKFGRRPSPYEPADYVAELGNLIKTLDAEQYAGVRGKLLAPSVATEWDHQAVFDTGLLDTYNANIKYVTMERYPNNNCAAQFSNGGTIIDPANIFPEYLDHGEVVTLVSEYRRWTALAMSKGKPFIMFETNTASCGGFHGISNALGGGLWLMDYGLQMAYSNFSQALLHVGGQEAFYNPFTPPPTNQSSFHQWTMGPPLYAALMMGEVIGSSGKARVKETFANENSQWTPSYVIYENDVPVRVALINYMSDNTRASDYYASLTWPAGQTPPASVKVKYFTGDSVSVISNYTWAGQTFGGNFEADGRLKGEMVIEEMPCENGKCRVRVPAPSFALVFLTDEALSESDSGATQTFATTAGTRTHNTATVESAVLATSNGHSGLDGMPLGSTSQGSSSGALSRVNAGLATLGAVACGVVVVALRSFA